MGCEYETEVKYGFPVYHTYPSNPTVGASHHQILSNDETLIHSFTL